jgi:hypothetical protein
MYSYYQTKSITPLIGFSPIDVTVVMLFDMCQGISVRKNNTAKILIQTGRKIMEVLSRIHSETNPQYTYLNEEHNALCFAKGVGSSQQLRRRSYGLY